MKEISRIIILAIAAASFAACGPAEEYPGLDTVAYEASDAVIPNPERGFYSAAEINTSTSTAISKDGIDVARKQGRTLFLLEFHMKDYVASDIADDYLQMIRSKFQNLRSYGAKCVLRFCYSNGMDEKDKPWDATKDQVLRHIAQLKPILQEYYDVIMVVQAGFIGSWGEWYYTDNFKDDADRKAVVDALLDAIPDRQIALRTPAYKMKLYGYSIADTITRAEAHQPTTKARLAGHNDCYLSSSNDVGTYNGPNDRKYWGAESLYTIMGGESCELTGYCHCEGSDKYNGALKDLAINHFTYINNGYHPRVLGRWREEGCMEEIQKRLGYRYVLEKAFFTKAPKAGDPLRVVLKIRNDGFAPAQNPRDAELVLTDKNGKAVGTWPLESDPRYWLPGEVTVIDQTVNLPSGVSGECTLHLNLPDPCQTLRGNSRFSIRLANEDIWDEETGYNALTTLSL
ncbi:MAG: DUF4832 domain-containing protein [Bacteroidales bacterium]|nr:DUF4832 domain-containing protein [Bacteroidales bacterium]MBP5676092.1 DUF4832 domain-containing protein [Bacteroidales bacterium]